MGMKATREQLYAAIQREREHQRQKYPDNGSGKPLCFHGYMVIMHEELKEARLAFCKHTNDKEALRELLQVVAVGFASFGNPSIEQIENLPAWEFEHNKHLPFWLEQMENHFALARAATPELAMYHRNTIIAIGMRALVEHGIVEREEFGQSEGGQEQMEPVTDEQADAFVRALYARVERDQQPKTITMTANNRGFMSGDFEDLNGILCSIQESSLATDDAIWLGVHPTPSEHEKRGYGPTRMHLNRQHVAALLPLLQHFVETGELPQAETE